MLFLFALLTQTLLASGTPDGKYAEIVQGIRKLNNTYKNFSQVISLGDNDDGIPIVGLRISLTPNMRDSRKIAHFVVGTHHGNEKHAPVFTLAFTESLLKKYRTRESFREGLNETEWYIFPVLNISGYNRGERREKNVDPNRDYPGPCARNIRSKLKSVRLVQDFLKTRVFSASLTVHGYIGSLTYPWGVDTSNTHSLDHNFFDQVVGKAASFNKYKHGTSTDVIYPCNGSFEDYTYWKQGLWSVLLELKNGSNKDIQDSVEAAHAYFSQVNSSPSLKNQFNGQCKRSGKPDLQNE